MEQQKIEFDYSDNPIFKGLLKKFDGNIIKANTHFNTIQLSKRGLIKKIEVEEVLNDVVDFSDTYEMLLEMLPADICTDCIYLNDGIYVCEDGTSYNEKK